MTPTQLVLNASEMSDTFLQPVIRGQNLLVRPMVIEDFEQLYRVAADPLIWAQHPSPLRYQREIFQPWFLEGIKSKGALVVEHLASGFIVGTSRYYDFDAVAQQVSIGFTFLSRDYWGGQTNSELKKLMLSHAFNWVNTVWFHVAPQNFRSQRALEKIGASLSHRAVKELTGGSQEYLFYRIDAPTVSP